MYYIIEDVLLLYHTVPLLTIDTVCTCYVHGHFWFTCKLINEDTKPGTVHHK